MRYHFAKKTYHFAKMLTNKSQKKRLKQREALLLFQILRRGDAKGLLEGS